MELFLLKKSCLSAASIVTNAGCPVFTGMLHSESTSRGEVQSYTWEAHAEQNSGEATDQGQLLTFCKNKIVFPQRHFHGLTPKIIPYYEVCS